MSTTEPPTPTTTIWLGNINPQMQVPDGEGGTVSQAAEHLKQSVTRVDMTLDTIDPESVAHTLSTDNDRYLMAIAKALPSQQQNYAVAIYELEQIIAAHMGGAKPTWVTAEDEDLAIAISEYLSIPIGQPMNILTNAGRDALHEQHIGTSAQPAAFKYGALSKSAVAPVATNTTLSEEITTAGGGLLRAASTFAHTAGTNTSTLTHTWTANGSDVTPVTIKKWANFNATPSGGTMGEEDLLSSEAIIAASGDSLTVTFTLTAG